MALNDRFTTLFGGLVSKEPIVVHDPLFWSNDGIIRQFISIKAFLVDDDPQQSQLLEARQVFYRKNTFIVSLDWLSLFLDDILGDWEGISVERLVQDVIIQVNGSDVYRGAALGCMQHLPCPTRELDLSWACFELHKECASIEENQAQDTGDWSSASTADSLMHSSIASDETWDTVTLMSEVGGDMAWDLNENIEG
jgi:hypothetical protein